MGVEESYQEQFAVQAIISFRLKNNFDRAGEAAPLVTSGDQKAKTNKKEKPAGLLPSSNGAGGEEKRKKRKNCVMKGVGNPNASR